MKQIISAILIPLLLISLVLSVNQSIKLQKDIDIGYSGLATKFIDGVKDNSLLVEYALKNDEVSMIDLDRLASEITIYNNLMSLIASEKYPHIDIDGSVVDSYYNSLYKLKLTSSFALDEIEFLTTYVNSRNLYHKLTYPKLSNVNPTNSREVLYEILVKYKETVMK